MELRLDNGKYVCDDRGSPISDAGTQEILTRALFKLASKQGEFPFIPNLGSRLYTLHKEKKSNLNSAAMQFVMEALEDEKEIQVVSVDTQVDRDEIRVTANIMYSGSSIQLGLTV